MSERTIFIEALERDEPAERSAFLDQACGGDPGLRSRVEQLLALHRQAGSFLESPPAALQSDPREMAATVLQDAGSTPRPRNEGEPTAADAPAEGDAVLDWLAPSDKPGVLGTLGPYEVTEIIGRGGMGVVLKAHDTRLNRVVAVKVLAPELASNATARRRFLREAQAAAAVSHDHVVTIHAIDETDRLPYLVMEYVAGRSLQQRIDQTGPLEVREILRIGRQIAAGLAAAHEQGLIHRDIKPANILLENGVERVKITDFGLARAVDDVTMTQTGLVAGTPLYMSPEQANAEPIDHRSDLFSLGSVLYVMCTGRSPFRASTTLAVIRRVCQDEPRPIQEINPDIPEWLVELIDRLLEKKADDRFQSAAEVAALLGRFLAHLQQPSVMPPPGLPVGPRRGGSAAAAEPVFDAEPTVDDVRAPARPRRSAALLVTAAAACLVLVPLLAAVLYVVIRIATPHGTLVVEVDDPQATVVIDGEDVTIELSGTREVLRLKPGRYRLTAAKDGRTVWQFVEVTRGERLVVRAGLEPPPADPLAPPAPAAAPRPVVVRRFEGSHIRPITSVAVSPDGRRLLSGSFDGSVRLWDLETGREVRGFLQHLEQGHTSVPAVAFSPDGRLAASGDVSGRVIVRDMQTFKTVHVLEGRSRVRAVAFSPDGRLLASGSARRPTDDLDNSVRLWDIESGRELRQLAGVDQLVNSVAWSPDGRRLLVGGSGGLVGLWDAGTGRLIRKFSEGSEEIWSVAFSPDGRWAVCGQGLPHKPAFRDGKFLNPKNSIVRVWDVESGGLVRILRGHTGPVNSVAFSPDGRFLLTGSGGAFHSGGYSQAYDNTLRLWDAQTGEELGQADAGTRIAAVAFTPDARFAVSGGGEFTAHGGDDKPDLRLWQLPTDRDRARSGDGRTPGTGDSLAEISRVSRKVVDNGFRASFSPDGRQILYTRRDMRGLEILDLETGSARSLVKGSDELLVKDGVFSPDGLHVAYVCQRDVPGTAAYYIEEIWLMPAQGGETHKLADGAFPCWSADSRQVYFHDRRTNTLRSISLDDREAGPRDVAACPGWYPKVAPDGKHFAYSMQNELRIAELSNGQVIRRWTMPTSERGLFAEWSPDSREVSVGGYGDSQAGLWTFDVERGEARRAFNGPVTTGVWSPDRTQFAFDVRGPRCEVWVADIDPERPTAESLDATSWSATPVDLQPWANQALNEMFGRSYPENTLAALPQGSRTLAGVRFQIGPRCIQLGSRELPDRPRQAELKIGRSVEVLRILHGTQFGSHQDEQHRLFLKEGTEIGLYEVRYSDGERVSIPIVYGTDVRDWWGWDKSPAVKAGMLAWTGTNPISSKYDVDLRLYVTTWRNPRPEAEVDSITFRSAMNTVSAPFCVAMTIENPGRFDADASRQVPVVTTAARQFQPHPGACYQVNFSPDGRLAVSVGSDETARVWAVADGEEIARFDGHRLDVERRRRLGAWGVVCAAFSPDGRHVLSGGWDGAARVWEAESGDQILALEGHKGVVTSAAFSPDGRAIATVASIWSEPSESLIRLWDAETGREVRQFDGLQLNLSSVAFTHDGSRLVTTSGNGIVCVWDVQTGEELHRLVHSTKLHQAAFSPDGRLLATAAAGRRVVDGRLDDPENCVVRIWDLQTGRLVRTLAGHSGSVRSVAFSPDGRFVLSSSGHEHVQGGDAVPARDATVRLWDARTGRELCRFAPEGSATIHHAAFSPDGQAILSCDEAGVVRLWEAPPSLMRLVAEPGAQVSRSAVFARAEQLLTGGPQESIHCIAVSADGRRALTGHHGGPVCLWDVESGRALSAFAGHTETVGNLVFAHDERYAISAAEDATIRVWDLETGEEVRQFAGHEARVKALHLSPDGVRLLSGCVDYKTMRPGTLRLWDVETGEEIRQFPGRLGWMIAARFLPDGGVIAIDRKHHALLLWDTATGRALDKIEGTAAMPTGPNCLDVSPDGRYAVTGHAAREQKDGRWHDPENCVLRLWDLKTFREVRRFHGHAGPVLDVRFSPDGKYLLSASRGQHDGEPKFVETTDQTVRLWEVETGREVCRYEPRERIYSVAFLPDGRSFLTGGLTMLRLWRLPDEAVARGPAGLSGIARSLATRLAEELPRMEDDEWTQFRDAFHGLMAEEPWMLEAVFDDEFSELRRQLEARFSREEWQQIEEQHLEQMHQDAMARIAELGGEDWEGLHKRTVIAIRELPAMRRTMLRTLRHFGVTLPDDATPKQIATVWVRTLRGLGDGGAAASQSLNEVRRLEGHNGPVRAVAFLPDGRRALSCSSGLPRTLRVWDVASGETVRQFSAPALQSLFSAAVSPDGATAATGHYDGTVCLWDLEAGRLIRKDRLHEHNVYSLQFTADGQELMSASVDQTILFTRADTGQPARRFDFGEKIRAAALSPDGRLILVGNYAARLVLLDAATGDVLHEFHEHRDPPQGGTMVLAVAFSPDGRLAASGCGSGAVYLWDIASRRLLSTLRGHAGSVEDLAFSPDGERLISGALDRSLRVWDTRTGSPLAAVTAETHVLHRIAVSPDGRQILTGGGESWSDAEKNLVPDGDFGLRLWRLPNDVIRPARAGAAAWPATGPTERPERSALYRQCTENVCRNLMHAALQRIGPEYPLTWVSGEVNDAGGEGAEYSTTAEFRFRGTRPQAARTLRALLSELEALAGKTEAEMTSSPAADPMDEFAIGYVADGMRGTVRASLDNLKPADDDADALTGTLVISITERPAAAAADEDSDDASALFRRFEESIRKAPSVSLLYDGEMTTTRDGVSDRRRYWGAFQAKPGGRRSLTRFLEGEAGGRHTVSGLEVEGGDGFHEPARDGYFIGQVTRGGFYSEALGPFRADGQRDGRSEPGSEWGLTEVELQELGRMAGVSWAHLARIEDIRIAEADGGEAADDVHVIAYTLRPAEDAACDVRLTLSGDALVPLRRVVRFDIEGREFVFTERYGGVSTDEIAEPFSENIESHQIASFRIERGRVSKQHDFRRKETDWLLDGGLYRADEATRLVLYDGTAVLLAAGSEFRPDGSHIELHAGLLSADVPFHSRLRLRLGPVHVGNAPLSAGRSLLTVSPDRIVIEQGAASVHPAEGGRQLMWLREGFEYALEDGGLTERPQRTLPAALPVRLAERVVREFDLNDAQAVASLLELGTTRDHDGRTVLAAAADPDNPRQQVLHLRAAEDDGLFTLTPSTCLRFRYRFSGADEIDCYQHNRTREIDYRLALVFAQPDHWTTCTIPVARINGTYDGDAAFPRPGDEYDALRWVIRGDGELLIDRIEVVEVGDLRHSGGEE